MRLRNATHNVTPLKSGRICPRCGAPLIFNQDKSTEYCIAPDRRNPLRQCRYAIVEVSKRSEGRGRAR